VSMASSARPEEYGVGHAAIAFRNLPGAFYHTIEITTISSS
jgi:hypothetical protein